jgi:hypothetical protein
MRVREVPMPEWMSKLSPHDSEPAEDTDVDPRPGDTTDPGDDGGLTTPLDRVDDDPHPPGDEPLSDEDPTLA